MGADRSAPCSYPCQVTGPSVLHRDDRRPVPLAGEMEPRSGTIGAYCLHLEPHVRRFFLVFDITRRMLAVVHRKKDGGFEFLERVEDPLLYRFLVAETAPRDWQEGEVYLLEAARCLSFQEA